jgi:dsDNA-binding SOS-regulon protein
MVYLEDSQFLLLKRVAASSKKRMSEIIREALSCYLSEKKEKLDYFSFVGIAKDLKREKPQSRQRRY